MSALAKNYNRRKISFKKGKGSFLYSTNGKKYLDFVQGIAVNSLGHANPFLIKAIGPPNAASGPTCPTQKPRVAPENLPSVIKATFSPLP